MVLGAEGLLDGQDQLGQHWEDLSCVLVGVEELVTALVGQEEIWLGTFSEALEEDGQIEMVIQELEFLDLPGDLFRAIIT